MLEAPFLLSNILTPKFAGRLAYTPTLTALSSTPQKNQVTSLSFFHPSISSSYQSHKA